MASKKGKPQKLPAQPQQPQLDRLTPGWTTLRQASPVTPTPARPTSSASASAQGDNAGSSDAVTAPNSPTGSPPNIDISEVTAAMAGLPPPSAPSTADGTPFANGSVAPGKGEEFMVRVGPNYSKTGKKEPSRSAMYDLVAVDIMRTQQRIAPITQLFSPPKLSPRAAAFQHESVPRLFVLNIQLPEQPASIFGKDDGPSIQIVMFFEINNETMDALADLDKAEPAYKLLVEYFARAVAEPKFRGRFKLIGKVMNDWAAAGLPSLLEGYNAKPVLITNSGNMFEGPNKDYKEMSVNVHMFSFIARKSLTSLRDKFRQVDAEVGVVIESRTDDEMPERMLCCAHFSQIDPFMCEELLPEVQDWLFNNAGASAGVASNSDGSATAAAS
eukprot:m.84068 g.84068  ORF g.84068 m.84068 type:complete len:386 (+) comp15005_c0_seq1:158-1315(+)